MNEEMKKEVKHLMVDYITEDECEMNNDGVLYSCELCSNFEECYINANSECNSEYAKSIDYGGCNNEEEFWGQMFD